jgi:hypothetical protein
MSEVPQRFSEEADHRFECSGGSRQMVNFAKGLRAYANGEAPPYGCYPGECTKALALELAEILPLDAPLWMWAKFGGTRVVRSQMEDLSVFGCTFDTWSRESDLHSPRRTNSLLWAWHVSGLMPLTLGNGNVVCGECGHLMTPHVPCQFCLDGPIFKSGFIRDVTDAQIQFNRKFTAGPGVHPDNDFMEGDDE